jgi:hypothetical protein
MVENQGTEAASVEHHTTVGFDWVSQSYIYSNSFPESTESVKVTFSSDLFNFINDNYRLGSYVLGLDPKQLYLEFDSSAERLVNASDSANDDLAQTWIFRNLKAGVNPIHVRLCHPRTESRHDVIPPSSEDKYVIEFAFPIMIGEIPEIPSELLATLPDSSLVLKQHLPQDVDLSLSNVAFWGVTREAISQEANLELSPEDWANFCRALDENMERVFYDNIADTCASAIDEYSSEEEGDEETQPSYYLGDAVRIIYSWEPLKDSTPHFVFLERENLEDLTDMQWSYVQSSMISRQQLYLVGYLPHLIQQMKESE